MRNVGSTTGDSRSQTSSKNFWSTLPGILTGIVGVIGAATTFVTVMSSFLNKPQSFFINVPAKSIEGEAFINRKSDPVKVDFQAKGRWSAIPETVASIKEQNKGYITADGYTTFGNSNRQKLPCPTFPLGALVVKIPTTGNCVASGVKGTFDLGPHESAIFLMNDVGSLYRDNDGQIEVALAISKK